MSDRRSDRVLKDWDIVASSTQRPEIHRRSRVQTRLSLASSTAVIAVVALVGVLAVLRSQVAPAVPAASTPLASASAGVLPSASGSPSSATERQASIVARTPGIFGTGCSAAPAVTAGAMWLVHGNAIDRIDTATNAIVAEVLPDLGPSLQLVSTGDAVWIAPGYCETGTAPAAMVVKRIDPTTNTIDAMIDLPDPGILTADVGRLWVTTLSTPRRTAVLNLDTQTLGAGFPVQTVPVAACGSLWDVQGNPDGTQTILARINPESGAKLGEAAVDLPAIDLIAQIGSECRVLAPATSSDPTTRPPSVLIRIDANATAVIDSLTLAHPAIVLNGRIWERWSDPSTDVSSVSEVDPDTGTIAGTSELPTEVASAGLWGASGTVWAQVGDTGSSAMLVRLDLGIG